MEARLIALAEHLQAEKIMGLCADAGCVIWWLAPSASCAFHGRQAQCLSLNVLVVPDSCCRSFCAGLHGTGKVACNCLQPAMPP